MTSASETLSVLLKKGTELATANSTDANEYYLKAFQLVKGNDSISIIDQIKVLGEYAIFIWKNTEIKEAFTSLNQGAFLLLETKEDSESWKSLAVIYGHLCGYLSSIAATGKPAELTLEKEVYTIPEPGLFLNYGLENQKFYRNSVDLYILIQLLLYAEVTGENIEARTLAFKIYQKTFAEMKLPQKNRISHRARALQKAVKGLKAAYFH